MLRICRKLNIKSTIKYSNNGCTRQAADPQYIAENILNREFTAKAPNEKWLTDVTEFHYYIGIEKHKVYLSAILDLYDRRIVSYVIRDKNNNALVFDTVDNALLRNPGAQPNIINLRLDITHLYYPAKNSFQKGRLKRREIFTELLLYTLTT